MLQKRITGVFIIITILGLVIFSLTGCGGGSGGTSTPNIYTAGYYFNGTIEVPCDWIGKTKTDLLVDGSYSAKVLSIYVSGSTVYTAGSYNDGTKDVPCYWSGTTRIDLPVAASYNTAGAFSIFMK